MQLNIGKTLDNTPLGCRIVFGLSTAFYVLYTVDHHLFIGLDLVCRPADVIYGLQLQRLVLASFVHTSLIGLVVAVALSWRRFAWLEHHSGTLGFLIWFVWTSVLLHGTFCLVALFLATIFGQGLLTGEVHGLFPLLTANLVASIKDSDSSTVWLWPLPFHVSVRAFPLVVIGLTWILHLEAHFDVIVAYALAALCPQWLVEPPSEFLDKAEQSPFGGWLLSRLTVFEAFVCRQPCGGSDDFGLKTAETSGLGAAPVSAPPPEFTAPAPAPAAPLPRVGAPVAYVGPIAGNVPASPGERSGPTCHSLDDGDPLGASTGLLDTGAAPESSAHLGASAAGAEGAGEALADEYERPWH